MEIKNISRSLVVIAGVAALAIGGTIAYFSDTETAPNNTLNAGTIDIDVDGKNPWNHTYTLGDMKPGETANIDFKINNVGANPVNISKKLYGIVGNGGNEKYDCTDSNNSGWKTSSEPECVAEQEKGEKKDDIQSQIVYDLSVEVWKGETKLWWQTIYSDAENKTITDVYGANGGNSIKLGMIPVGGYMKVKQSYHLKGETPNEYQGDELKFDMEIRADQLSQTEQGNATVTLENKSGNPDWNIIEDDINGILTYSTKGPTFNYSFSGKVKTDGSYTLIYVGPSGNYPCSGSKVIGSGTSSSGSISFNGNTDLGVDINNGKVWLVPSSTYDTSNQQMIGWDHANNLYETALINYDDTDVSTP